MTKIYIAFFIFGFIILFTLIGCANNRSTIYSNSLCNCEPNSPTTRDAYHKRYECSSKSACVTNLGYNGKWVVGTGVK